MHTGGKGHVNKCGMFSYGDLVNGIDVILGLDAISLLKGVYNSDKEVKFETCAVTWKLPTRTLKLSLMELMDSQLEVDRLGT